MGCFNSSGCISQLLIHEGQRVAGILCYIESDLDFCDAIRLNGSYTLVPMCPIIYGVYNDYGYFTPDKGSKTVKILEKFFDQNIDDILKYFCDLTYGSGNDIPYGNEQTSFTKKLTELRKPKDASLYMYSLNIPKEANLNNPYNKFCLVLEHEDVVNKLIESQGFQYFSWNYGIKNKTNAKSWEDLYDEQLKICKDFGLDNFDAKFKDDDVCKGICELAKLGYSIFPIGPELSNLGLYMNDLCFMYFLRHYSSNFHYIFDGSIKDEYLNTIRFWLGLRNHELKMYLKREGSGQNDDTIFFKSLVETYTNILNNYSKSCDLDNIE